MKQVLLIAFFFSTRCLVLSCNEEDPAPLVQLPSLEESEIDPSLADVYTTFGGNIDPNNLYNYANQEIPEYIYNSSYYDNLISDEGATLGRVLFYDKKLSSNDRISCASCHQQAHGFGDPNPLSQGVNGSSKRHSMRLVNVMRRNGRNLFWDRRAESMNELISMVIRDHTEMGYSGQDGAPDFEDLIEKLSKYAYYQELFTLKYGDPEITEERIQAALTEFVRSIQSFDSKFDEGRAMVDRIYDPFPNYTEEENLGKDLFRDHTSTTWDNGIISRTGGGFYCRDCHSSDFNITNFDGFNNGVIGVANNPNEVDLSNVRAPSLRDLFNPEGELNSPLMHNGVFTDINQVVDHYNFTPEQPNNPGMHPRLVNRQLNITPEERSALIAFLKTLSGKDVYTHEKWNNPFLE